MRTLLAGILLLCGFSAAQNAIKGDLFTSAQPVIWGGHNYISMGTASGDTASAWLDLTNLNSPNAKPGMAVTLSYRAKATDSTSSSVVFLIESRYCAQSSISSGCDSLVTLSGYNYTQASATGRFIDTLSIVNPRAVYVSQTGNTFYLPAANQIRFKVHRVSISSGKTWQASGLMLLAQ